MDKKFPIIEFYQFDWIPGFAALAEDGKPYSDVNNKAFCVLNIGSIVSAIAQGDLPREEAPYAIAEFLMHEITHVIEKWAEVEFSEERVDALIEKYSKSASGAQ